MSYGYGSGSYMYSYSGSPGYEPLNMCSSETMYWNNDASFEGTTCSDIADAVEYMALLMGTTPDDPGMCEGETAEYYFFMDMAGCCEGGNSMCTDPSAVCNDASEWTPDNVVPNTDGTSCAMMAMYAQMSSDGMSTSDQAFCSTTCGGIIYQYFLGPACCGSSGSVCDYVGGGDMDVCEDGGGSYSYSPGGGSDYDDDDGDAPSAACMYGCIADCYGSSDFDHWNREQCTCLLEECVDSRDCTSDDAEKIVGYVESGCREGNSDDYSYDYQDIAYSLLDDDTASGAAGKSYAGAAAVAAAVVATIAY